VLRGAELVAAEDTRKARTLLRELGIGARLISYYDFNEQSRAAELLGILQAGKNIAVITDAGSPLVSDPGYRIVTAAIKAGVRVIPLPGPSAALTALIGSGLPAHEFRFAGFLPRKPAARRVAITALASPPETLIIFESPHRLLDSLTDLRHVLGDRKVALARNLTKADEEYLRGPLSEIVAQIAERNAVHGEYTVVIEGARPQEAAQLAAGTADQIVQVLLHHQVPPHVVRDAIREVTGLPRNDIYRRVQLAQRKSGNTGS
jgi:16S rRNA (cytidine1402-2'-O)-methyltransferase